MDNFVRNVTADAVDQMYGGNNSNVTLKNKFDKNRYLNTSLGDDETQRTVTIRILPISAEDSSPFVEIKTHSLKVDKNVSKSGFKTYVCLNTPNLDLEHKEKCPLCAKATEYYQLSQAETDQSLKESYLKKAKSLFNKKTYIARVIERGKENEGVKFWRFNARNDENDPFNLIKKIYKTRCEESLRAGAEVPYNIYDLVNGRDLTLTITHASSGNGVAISVIDSGFQSPLSKDVEIANKWINDDKVWKDMYGIKQANYLSIIADDLIPFWDKENGEYVGKTPEEIEAQKGDETKVSEEIKKEFLVENASANVISNDNQLSEDLPF